MTSPRKTAVVTGGAGFIGSHMVDLLVERGYAVRVIDNLVGGREANLAQHAGNPDVVFEQSRHPRAPAGTTRCSPARDYVFHFAGIGDIVPSIERPIEYMSVNVQGTVHMLECARACGRQEVRLCGVVVLLRACRRRRPREDHPIAPQYPYALSKYQGEQAALHWHQVYRLPVNSIRIFNAYGTRSRTSGAYGAVFGVFLRQKLAGKPFTVVGDGTQRRDFLYVTDVAAGVPARRREPAWTGEIWNLGAGNPQSVNRLVELLGGPVVHIPKRPGEPDCTFADIAQDHGASSAGSRKSASRRGCSACLPTSTIGATRRCGTPESIAKATARWFNTLSSPQAAT